MDRKQLSPNESDKVARHRNLMHEIALKKQISVIQREGRLLERELREITKVKKTLMQIRDPLRRRLAQTHRENIDEQEIVNIKKKATAVYGLPRQTKSSHVNHNNKHSDSRFKREALLKSRGALETNSCHNSEQLQLKLTGKPPSNNQTKANNSHQTTENSTSLPAINSRLDSCLTISESCTSDESGSEPRRPETSMTVAMRRCSVALPQPPSTSLGHRREEHYDNANSLTMEETLRIKGKFRQIGHSIIATALLKGLRQGGQLTSEAIHNMHKPISFDKTDKKPENTDEQDNPKPSGLQKFRSLTRKAINVNTIFSLQNKQIEPANKPNTSTELDHPPTPQRKRKLGIAGASTIAMLSTDTGESNRPLMNLSTQIRRRKIGIGGMTHVVMVAKPLNDPLDDPTKKEQTVRFMQEAWE